jgi:predicted nucleotidyltransferase
MIDRAEIQAMADRIAREFQPERIILFGSYARGTSSDDSDVDLLVVADCPAKPWKLATQIRRRVRPQFALDLLVRSPEELHWRLAQHDPFLSEVAEQGTVLYEAHHG